MKLLFIFLLIFIAWNQLKAKTFSYFEKKQKLENDLTLSLADPLNQNKLTVGATTGSSKETAFTKIKKGQKKVSVKKEDLLPENFYEPKQTKKELKRGFKAHLDQLTQICSLDQANRSRDLKAKIENLKKYLADSLSDPYMDYKTALLFADILSVMEEDAVDAPDSFDMAYKLLYNIDEAVQPKDYSHEWARIFHDSVKCSQKYVHKL